MIRFFLVLLIACTLSASTPWNRQDVAMEGLFVASAIQDWGQTLDIQSDPFHLQEQNSIMGRHPTRATVNEYFATAILLHVMVANQLSGSWRTAWQMTWIGLEAGTIQRNYRLGIRLNF